MSTFVYTLAFSDTSTSVITTTVMAQSVRLKRVLWNDMRACGDRLAFDMRWNAVLFNKIVADTGDVGITVTKDGSAWFKGILTKSLQLDMDARPGNFSIEATDMGEKFRHRINSYFTWAAYKVCDPADIPHSIVHQLAYLAGFSAGDLAGIATISKTIDYFSNDDLTNKYWDLLDELLFQFGYTFYFTASGVLALFDCYPATATASFTFATGPAGNCIAPLSTRKADRQYQDVQVNWFEHLTLVNQIVFSETQGASIVNKCVIPVLAGGYYPVSSHVESTYAEFKLDGYELLSVLNPVLEAMMDADVSTHIYTAESKRAQICFANAGAVTEYVKQLDIRGSAIVKSIMHKTRQTAASELLLEIDAGYINASADATRLSSGLKRHYQYAPYSYTVSSRSSVALGAIVSQTESAFLGQSNKCIVVQIVENAFTGTCEYTLEGIEAYTADATTTQGLVIAQDPGTTDQWTTDQRLGVAIGNRPTYAEVGTTGHAQGGMTLTPSVPTISGVEAIGKALRITWDDQPLLSNLDRYEVQVSANGTTGWSSLTFDGTGNGIGTAGQDTDWWEPSLLHTLIPYDGTAEAPTGRTLYYQVRRVTRASLASNWSAVANGSTAPMAEGDIAANAITADKIEANAVTAAKIEAGAITADKIAANAITADKIEANAVTAAKITAGAITADKIALNTITDDQVSSAALTSKSLKFTDNVHENDDPLPAGAELFDFRMPSCKSSSGRVPQTGRNIVYEPWYIGDVLNPRVKTNFQGAIGVWKATTNRLTSPQDWTSYFDKTAGTTIVQEYNSTVAQTVSHIEMTATNNYIRKEYNQGTSVSGQTWTFSCCIYAAAPYDLYLNLDDSAAYFGNEKKSLVAGLNYITITATATGLTGTVVHADISCYNMNGGGDYLGPKTVYLLWSQLELSAYATPFTPMTRAAGSLAYAMTFPSVGKIELWMRPHGAYGDADGFIIFRWDSGGQSVDCYYEPSVDKLYFRCIKDVSNYRYAIKDSAFNAGTWNTWIHVACLWDLSSSTISLYINGTLQSGAESAGSISTIAPGSVFSIGTIFGTTAYEFDGLITDLAIWNTADTSTTHYTTGRPYYDETSLPCANFGARLSATGLELYNGSIDIQDSYNRQILISNAEGMKAKDAAGNVIHDLPNGLVIANQKYMGHVSCLDEGSYVAEYTEATADGIKNIDITSKIGSSTNIKGVVLNFFYRVTINTTSAASYESGAFILYNSAYNNSTLKTILSEYRVQLPAAPAAVYKSYLSAQAICPVFWVSGVCYLSLFFFKWVSANNALLFDIVVTGVVA